MAVKMKEKSDIKPIILKVGVALALSFASFLYSRLRTRRVNRSLPPPPPPPQSPRSSDHGNEVDSRGKARRRDEIHGRRTRPSFYGAASVSSEKYDEAYTQNFGGDNSIISLSPRGRLSGDKDGFLSSEFNDLVKEFDSSAATAGVSPEDVDTPSSDVKTPKAFISAQKDEYEQEISHLQNMVRLLRERERNLEVQLLEYYGVKEQETTVMELQNRLKLNNMEAKLFSIKIESLHAENQRLDAQVAGHAKLVAELEAARVKIKLLKKKLRFEAEQNKEQILNIQQRVTKMQDEEFKSLASNSDVQLKLKRIKDLEGETEELRKSNLMLQLENSELARRLESTQILANSVLENPETDASREESMRLIQENQDLRQEIEQLKADRCVDIEELVYLRWINACLRYELRDYQPATGKTVARDLSKTLSPKSEEKAKQLILDYANTVGMDFDSDQWSSSQASYTDSGDLDESSLDNSSTAKTNTSSRKKFFNKLRKLVRGKDGHHSSQVLSGEKPESLELDGDSPRYGSSILTGDYPIADSNRFKTSSPNMSRLSFDMSRSQSLKEGHVSDVQRNSDVVVRSSYVYKSFVLDGEAANDSTPKDDNEKHSDYSEKSELLKYAGALRRSRRGTPKLHRKSASYSSF